MFDRRAWCRAALLFGTALACCGAQAEPDSRLEPIPIDGPHLEIDTVPQWLSRPASRWDGPWQHAPNPTMARAASSAFGEGVRARWWWGRGSFSVGAGADWRGSSSTPTSFGPESAGPPRPRLALEVRAKSTTTDLRERLLRVQMSGDAALHLRPRGGGLQIIYRESF